MGEEFPRVHTHKPHPQREWMKRVPIVSTCTTEGSATYTHIKQVTGFSEKRGKVNHPKIQTD